MKFYQIIAPVMLTMMHATAIFGAASPDYIFRDIAQSRYIAQSIGEFLPLYKETAHIKLYPSFLKNLLFYDVKYGNYGGPQDGYFEVMIPSRASRIFLNIASAVFVSRTVENMDLVYRRAATCLWQG